MTALSDSTLHRLSPAVAVPRYDRRALKAGVVHIGVGNFHRTQQALYIDEALHQRENEGFGICGVGLTDGDASRAKAAAYKAQDGLYTVTEFAPDGTARTRVIGAMIDYLHGPADPEAVLARLAHPDTRIVTLTITEGGYNIDETTGVFRLNAPEVAHDLAGGAPRTVFGYVVEALARRRAGDCGPSRSPPATTCAATATLPARPSCRSRGPATPISPTGSTARSISQTAWWIASPHR